MGDKMNICSACLSTDRRLISLHKITTILEEISLTELNNSTNNNLCWECWSVIEKFYKFKKKVQKAQDIIKQANKRTKFITLSALTVTTNINYDFEFIYNNDPLINQICIKKEAIQLTDKTSDLEEEPQSPVENIFSIHLKEFDAKDSSNLTKYDSGPTKTSHIDYKETTITLNTDVNEEFLNENIYTKPLDLKPDSKILKKEVKSYRNKLKKLRTEENLEEFRKKFQEVVLSEGEMLKLREAKRNHHNFKKIPFKCETCVLGFTREENLNLHIQKKHDESIGKYQCEVCSIRFPTNMAASKHKRKHYVCYKCRCCRYEAHELWSALNHCRTKHLSDEPDRIHCSQCDVVVQTPEELESHVQKVHSLHCNECGTKFKASSTLKRHMVRIHSIVRDFICDICSKTFKTKTRLESHMVKHNTTIAKRLSYCHICNVQYKNIYVYRNHLKQSANHTERDYSCSECSKRFASKVYLTSHYNFYHLRKSQHKCDICNKAFISDWRLKNHNQTHHSLSRPRNHACDLCTKKFYTLATLRTHRLTHSDQRSYMCEDCGRTFKQRPALYTHTRLLHRQTH